MAAQLEDGYTKIANEILDHISKVKLNGSQFRIVMAVFRFTYGFNRKAHAMSIGFLAEATGLYKRQVQRELSCLIEMNIIKVIKEASFSESAVLSFNKYTDQWCLIRREVTEQTPDDGIDVQTDVGLDTRGDVYLDTQEIKLKDNIKDTTEESNVSLVTPYEKIKALYHERSPSLPQIRTLSEERKKHIRARWNQYDQNIDVFKELFIKAELSCFLKGQNDRGWKADLDWLLNENNMAKVLEGKYDNNGRASPGQETNKPIYPMGRL